MSDSAAYDSLNKTEKKANALTDAVETTTAQLKDTEIDYDD